LYFLPCVFNGNDGGGGGGGSGELNTGKSSGGFEGEGTCKMLMFLNSYLY